MSERHPWAVSGAETAILNDIDHDVVTLNVVESLFSSGSIGMRLLELSNRYESTHEASLAAINDIGMFTRVTDPIIGIDPDPFVPAMFVSGGLIALETLSALAAEAGIDASDVLTEIRGRMTVIDINRRDDLSDVERFALLGSFIIQRGHLELEELDGAYTQLIDVVAEGYPETSDYSSHFKGGFGYVLGVGMRTAASLRSAASADELMAATNFEDELLKLLGSD